MKVDQRFEIRRRTVNVGVLEPDRDTFISNKNAEILDKTLTMKLIIVIVSTGLTTELTITLSSTTTLNVPDPAERKYKNETPGSSLAWLAVFGVLAVVVAGLLLSLLVIR